MLVDLLSPANYLMINKDAIKILGLHTAVYCSELLTIYKKVVTKKTWINTENYFQVDRNYIEKQTSLTSEEQLKCDLNLAKVNIIKIAEDNPNIIYFDVEIFSSVLASEDIKLLDKVSKTVKTKTPKGTKEANTKYIIQTLKESIECRTPEVLFKLRDWIDCIFENGKVLSKAQVKLFKDKLDDYCDGDLQLALKIIDSAIVHAYIDCQWAINSHEKDQKVQAGIANNISQRQTFTRPQEQRKTTEISKESF
jgi:hypothetical protein